MRFYTIFAMTNTDGTETRDMKGYNTFDEALVNFHERFVKNIGKCNSMLAMIIDNFGHEYRNESWKSETVDETEE